MRLHEISNVWTFVYKSCMILADDSPSGSPMVDIDSFSFTKETNVAKRGRPKKNEKSKTDAKCDEIDLTEYPVPTKRSKRSADRFDQKVTETIELGGDSNSNSSPNDEPPDILQEIRNSYEEKAAAPKRGRRKKGDPPAPKRLTYRQALKLTLQNPSPKKGKSPKKKKSPAKRKSPQKRAAAPVPLPTPFATSRPSSTAIDLTGEVVLTDKHSSAPLFQKQVSQPQEKAAEPMEEESDSDLDLDLDSIRVKVKTDKGIEVFKTRQHQSFQHIFASLAKKANEPLSKILIYNGDKRISVDDTPHSINCRISTVLKMSIMSTSVSESLGATSKKEQIEIKFQWDKERVDYRSARNKLENSLVLKVSKLDTFKVIAEMLCEKLKIDSTRLVMSFDGEQVDMNETPADLEFDGGETMDCKISAV